MTGMIKKRQFLTFYENISAGFYKFLVMDKFTTLIEKFPINVVEICPCFNRYNKIMELTLFFESGFIHDNHNCNYLRKYYFSLKLTTSLCSGGVLFI